MWSICNNYRKCFNVEKTQRFIIGKYVLGIAGAIISGIFFFLFEFGLLLSPELLHSLRAQHFLTEFEIRVFILSICLTIGSAGSVIISLSLLLIKRTACNYLLTSGGKLRRPLHSMFFDFFTFHW